MKLILQTEAAECGLACLCMIADHYGWQNDLASMRRQFLISLKGVNLNQLMCFADRMQLAPRPLRLELEDIDQLQLPCILHWNLNHFVVLEKVGLDWHGQTVLHLLDPASGRRKLSLAEAGRSFTGVALELTPGADFAERDDSRQISVRQLVGPVHGLRRNLVQLLGLALVLEVFALVSPLFNQFVLDDVLVSGDRELLTVLVIGFGILLLTQNLISLGRSWFLMQWNISLSLQWGARIFGHLLRLPPSFFEKRQVGDLVSRFGSMSSIQNTLSSLFVESLLDGLMTLLALGMMLLYSPKLSLIVLCGVGLYVGLRALFFAPFREAAQERLVLSARESSTFLETMRAIVPLKLFGREAMHRARWLNLRQDVANRDLKTQKMSMLFRVASSLISGTQTLLLLYVGAGAVLDNALSIGMLMAFTSYAGTFSGRIFRLIDLGVELRMLRMHAQRLADIVQETPEPEVAVETDLNRISGQISLRGVRFRYGEAEPWVLDGLNLDIPAGQSVAITGASGSGKSTLCKILLGLLPPTEGQILIDGIPLDQLGLRAWRSLVGTVMQDDVLLAGSIFDNICFFDSNPDQEQVNACAQMAAVHEEIMRMPMGYQTLVGDLGSSLSGGQKQRVLLARALYKKPRVLALDEATSHLDLHNERRVNTALAQLDLTRIMVAHRPQTIAMASRVLLLENGKVTELEGYREAADGIDMSLAAIKL